MEVMYLLRTESKFFHTHQDKLRYFWLVWGKALCEKCTNKKGLRKEICNHVVFCEIHYKFDAMILCNTNPN